MSTVARRTVRSTPHRTGSETWTKIVELLTHGGTGEARTELLAVSGVASSVITDQFPKNAPIVVTCSGPRTRIHCTYDEDAIDGMNASEEALGFDPLAGEWMVSFPCGKDDLAWVQAALKPYLHCCARSVEEIVEKGSTDADDRDQPLEVDVGRFLGR